MSAVSGEGARTGRFPVLAKYDVLEELGHGGMATVYRAHDRRLGRDVAVKVIHPHLRDSGEVARRFSIEAQAVAKLRHPNIVEVYDVSAEGEAEQYLVVELLRGRTLRKLLQTEGALPPEIAAAIGVELLGALGHAHAHGVIHRDVKPENVIIEHRSPEPLPSSERDTSEARPAASEPGERVLVKLTDFGIAKLLDVQGMTSTGQVLGSPAHMAPEQIEGQDVDGRADVFGVGVLLYECMVGHLPFEGNNPAQVLRRVLDGSYPSAERERPTIGKPWSQILDKALGRTPGERYADATAMRDAILHELKRVGVGTPRADLERYFDDPKGFTERQEKDIVPLLCERAHSARKRGDAMAAAADYNRALAYAPHDPALLRIVTSLHGAETLRRLFWRVTPLAMGTVILGTIAFAVTQKLARHPPVGDPPVQRISSVTVPVPAVGDPTLGGSSPSTSASTARPRPNSGPNATQAASKAPLSKPAQREVKFGEVFPPNIVQVIVDGDKKTLQDVSTERALLLPLDDQPHRLSFTCRGDWTRSCKVEARTIDPGDKAPVLQMHLGLNDATLIVHGNRSYKYALSDDASVKPTSDIETPVPMRDRLQRQVTVAELETSVHQVVTLTAGKSAEVTFPGSTPPP
jgi:eukaryotic-like serine/threonine-protein kinase